MELKEKIELMSSPAHIHHSQKLGTDSLPGPLRMFSRKELGLIFYSLSFVEVVENGKEPGRPGALVFMRCDLC